MAGKILIVDDVATNRIVLKVKLSAARYDTVQAWTGAEVLRQIAQEAPDLLLLDMNLPDIDGIALCRRIKTHPTTATLPVIVLSASPTPEDRLAALRAGADDFMAKPVDESILMARLRSLLRAREAEQDLRAGEAACRDWGLAEPSSHFTPAARIAVIAPDRETTSLWTGALARDLPNDWIESMTAGEALDQTAARAPDAYVIAIDRAQPGDGLRLMSELRSRAQSRNSVVCVAAERGDSDTIVMALDLGADDVLPVKIAQPVQAHEAALRLSTHLDRKRMRDRKRNYIADGLRLAMTDSLTGLYNRRFALQRLGSLADQARTSGQAFALMALDLDRFKEINDTFGHAAGDAVLTEVAQRLRNCLREQDLLARFGGEEFLIALPETSLAQAEAIASAICSAIEATPFSLPGDAGSVTVTISVGVTTSHGTDPVAAALDAADQALMRSKREGRNRVTTASRSSAA
ncbi:diguanylate cyclase [Sinirhodobacter sp. WL0062]|uniref:diguanylate cyclase n=1 Tax=Rhodobacter flavimaris TaxID=2907145 RepID=A0ABS8Z2U7_9RHOB|nr:diguanylate cyclase [Sinirhodobacter sp. WL0062]MCE5975183.1 diguanylate cyclase [Sinirhodobacter sp. WL0062]